MEQSSAAEQRAFAVAKLKRAASLPRMKDGRRPPMHVEAVSEGEKSQLEDRNEDEIKDGERKEDQSVLSDEPLKPQDPPPMNELRDEPSVETLTPAAVDEEPSMQKDEAASPAQKKRRRSRSRSRGSKDFKNKLRLMAPSPGPGLPLNQTSNESSEGEEAPPASPPVISPRPQRFDPSPSRILDSPFYPGTTPSTPMLPSLEALQKGLFRSNSASASSGVQRMMAMAKLTGEPFDPTAVSSPPPPAGKLARNNTVAGGERMAARALLFHRLDKRINTEGDQTSGGEPEDPPARIPTPIKRRRRRSRRNSARASAVVDDREVGDDRPPSTTPNTPLVPHSPLLPLHYPPLLSRPPLPHNDSFEYESPLGRRGVVIEDEDDAPESAGTIIPPGLPHTPMRDQLNGRMPHLSDSTSVFTIDSGSGVGVPMFLSQKHGLKGDVFPTSPFATPLREKAYLEDEDDQVAVYEDARRDLRPDPFVDRELSWIAEPGMSSSSSYTTFLIFISSRVADTNTRRGRRGRRHRR